MALITITQAVALTIIAGDFAGRASQPLAAAEDALEDPALLIPRYVGISAALALAFWLVKGSLDAMRVGLLTRFMGVFGIALGPAFVLQFGSLILPLWLIALGALFAGRWPGGLPPAWVTGEASPLPSAGGTQGCRRRGRREGRGRGTRPQRRGRPRWPGRAARRPAARQARPRIGWRPDGRRESIPDNRPGARRSGSGRVRGRREAGHRPGRNGDPQRHHSPDRREDRHGPCPDDVEARRGETFRCVAQASNGQRARVEVRQRDDEGSVSWRLIGQRQRKAN